MAPLVETLTYDYGWDDVDQKGDDCDYGWDDDDEEDDDYDQHECLVDRLGQFMFQRQIPLSMSGPSQSYKSIQ